MLVRLLGHFEELPGLGRVPVLAKSDQGLGISPVRRTLIVFLQKAGQFFVPPFGEQPPASVYRTPWLLPGLSRSMSWRCLMASSRLPMVQSLLASPSRARI